MTSKAANPGLLGAMLNAFRLPDLRRKLLFTFGILVVFRIAAHIPIPGVRADVLRQILDPTQGKELGQLLNMLNLFSGGAMENFSVAAMGVYPYITAQIVLQLLMPVVPALSQLSKEGEAGRNRLNQYTRMLAVPMAMLQGFGQVSLIQSQGAVKEFGFAPATLLPTIAILLSLAAGTLFCVWLGELITEFGIGNGISIIIFGGIVSGLPQGLFQSFFAGGSIVALLVFLVIGLFTVAAIVYVQEGQRRVPVQYAKRIRGTRMYGGQSTHIPLRVNSAGMIPLIFAASIMLFPATISSYFLNSSIPWLSGFMGAVYSAFNVTSPVYWLLYFLMVIGFTYFYTVVTFQQQNLPENLQKYGGFIPGIRPGRPTGEYLNRVLNRITLAGAVFLGVVAVLPFLARLVTGVQTLSLSSTALLIVVGVVIDTMKQLEAQLLMRHYEGFIR